jgi:DNA-binding NarL/FixJ family response regulator
LSVINSQWKCGVRFRKPKERVSRIRVLLADDYAAVISRVRTTLEGEFDVVGIAGNGSDAVSAVLRLDPDVLVIDISMPVMDGLRAALALRRNRCRAKIIFLTIHEDPDYVRAAFAAGASGYVTKSRLSTDLALAIREVVLGKRYLSAPLEA